MDDAQRSLLTAPLVVADLDGTLVALDVDWPALRRRLAERARALGADWHADGGIDGNLRRIRAAHGEAAFDALCAVAARAEVEGIDRGRRNEPLLRTLARRAGPVALCTANTRAAARHAAAVLGPPWRGAPAVAKEDVRAGKPDPEGLLRLCRLAGVAPADTLFIGDRESDRQAADRAGTAFLLVQMPTDGDS